MKKNVLLIVSVISFIGFGMSRQSANKPIFSDLALANIEALATPESFDGCHATVCQKVCYKNGVYHIYASESECHCYMCN